MGRVISARLRPRWALQDCAQEARSRTQCPRGTPGVGTVAHFEGGGVFCGVVWFDAIGSSLAKRGEQVMRRLAARVGRGDGKGARR